MVAQRTTLIFSLQLFAQLLQFSLKGEHVFKEKVNKLSQPYAAVTMTTDFEISVEKARPES